MRCYPRLGCPIVDEIAAKAYATLAFFTPKLYNSSTYNKNNLVAIKLPGYFYYQILECFNQVARNLVVRSGR